MSIRVGKEPQYSCRHVGIQQVIICVNTMNVVVPCLHVWTCNITNITSN